MAEMNERREFRLARIQAGMTAYDVDDAAGYNHGCCGNFENGKGALSELDELRLVDFLEAVVAYECQPKRDYRQAVRDFVERNKMSRREFSYLSGVSIAALTALDKSSTKTGLQRKNRKRLDEVLFAG
jgi:hypothetical protein